MGRGLLKTLPLAKLKRYVAAYNIKIDRAVEKEDLIDAMVAARVSHPMPLHAKSLLDHRDGMAVSHPRTRLDYSTAFDSHLIVSAELLQNVLSARQN